MRSRGFVIRCRAGSLHRSNEVSHDQQAHTLGTSQKSNNRWWNVEIFCMVAAQDEEKNHFSLRVKVGPDRDTMMPTKEPCRVGLIFVVWHYLSWQWLAHPEGSCDRPADAVPCPARLLPARTCRRMPVLLSRPVLPLPARCSRDTAKVAVFRLASSHPDRVTGCG